MGWHSITENEIDDIRTDRRSAEGIEKYMVSEKALYFEGKYLPLFEVRSVSIHDSVYNPHCCCGRGIPVKKIKVEYGADRPLILMLEKDANAQRLAERIENAADK